MQHALCRVLASSSCARVSEAHHVYARGRIGGQLESGRMEDHWRDTRPDLVVQVTPARGPTSAIRQTSLGDNLTMDDLTIPDVVRFSFDTDGDLIIECRNIFNEECLTRYLSPEQTRQLLELLKSRHSASEKP